MKLSKESESQFLKLSESNIYIEGNILKKIESENQDFLSYIEKAKSIDEDKRRKRLEVTRTVQDQNKELIERQEENEKLMSELKEALESAENAKNEAQTDLDLLQKRTQFQLIESIVSYALYVIVGVGITVTIMYIYSIAIGSTEVTLIGNAWSNLFGILLTNSFSIIGTIMGVKYANNSKDS